MDSRQSQPEVGFIGSYKKKSLKPQNLKLLTYSFLEKDNVLHRRTRVVSFRLLLYCFRS